LGLYIRQPHTEPSIRPLYVSDVIARVVFSQ